MNGRKGAVKDFWEQGSCGEVNAVGDSLLEQLEAAAAARYELEPYIPGYADFYSGKGKKVLEIGLGLGADHLEWAKSGPSYLAGVDLTERAVDFTRQNIELHGYESDLRVGDAENLPFDDETFDIVYSWGVLMCAPDTPQTLREVYRVLKPGGTARIMLYHTYSITGYMLWARFALMTGRPFTPLAEIYDKYLESPGTKAYTPDEAHGLFAQFSDVHIRIQLCHGDLLQGEVAQRHRGPLYSIAKCVWPRWFVKRFMKNHGLDLVIIARK
jgi:SAM-dependent methyltransferase